jgi:predicted 3-demethylubiquinone-9 3-methyltransferase (glyoxalase superfamily)
MPKISTFLSYDNQAEDAAKLYTSVFKNSKITNTTRYGDGAPMPKGTVMIVEFELDGQPFVALNGGPHFKFSDAISLSVNCETQAEIDEYSEKLTAGGGEQGPCGWSPTGLACHGRSILLSSARCWVTRIQRRLRA